MTVRWSEEVMADIERQGIEPALVQRALASPDEILPGPPVTHGLRYWDYTANREMWLAVRIEPGTAGATLVGVEKTPVYPD